MADRETLARTRADGRVNSDTATRERWLLMKRIVGDALELEPAKRSAFVAHACGEDAELRAEVEAILSAPADEIESFADDLDATLGSGEENSRGGERLGAYEIVREIGRGGMGAVYLARRADEQFDKQVAIKILKRGTDTDEVLRRFRSERQILARLEHPNIARMLDAGTTDDGLPYFVMEYVEGAPIADFCSRNQLNLRDRLQLFLKVCAAIHFAHQNLIVHRDIKPGNILVTDRGEPKLLDFGIAKLLDTAADVTAVDRQRFTPDYASPEQVRGEPITTVSDVYSLGALLYELLTGKPPHRFASDYPSPTELFRVVAEQEPQRPSAVAHDPALRARLRGDLDNILLQALRKEPARRYPGVNAFAEDIRRYLNNFPVRARNDTFRYRASKFVARNRGGVAAAALVLLALIAGIVGTSWQAHIAQRERAKAEQRFGQVRQFARAVMFDYHDRIAALPGSTEVRKTLVQDALAYLDSVAREVGSGDEALLRELADAYERVAALQGGAAVSARGATISSSNLGDTAGALASQQKAVAIREQLASRKNAGAADLQALGSAYATTAGFYLLSGPPDQAVAFLRKALPLLEALLAQQPRSEELRFLVSTAHTGMAKALGNPGAPNVGNTAGAMEHMRKAVALNEELVREHPGDFGYEQALAAKHNFFALLLMSVGDRAGQLEQNLKGVAAGKALVAADPANAFFRKELAVQLGNVGSTLMQMQEKAKALEYFREALPIYDALVAADPSDISTRRNWAVGHRNVGLGIGASDPAEAFRYLDKAVAIFRELVAKDPKNGDFGRQLAIVLLGRSRIQAEINDADGAIATAHQGIVAAEQVAAMSPADVSARTTLAQLLAQLGAAHAKAAAEGDARRHWSEARNAYSRSRELYEAMKAKGTLSRADAGKPDELTAEIAKCDAALQ
jgi:eukaryotic-like serine/threonine-protein kinase